MIDYEIGFGIIWACDATRHTTPPGLPVIPGKATFLSTNSTLLWATYAKWAKAHSVSWDRLVCCTFMFPSTLYCVYFKKDKHTTLRPNILLHCKFLFIYIIIIFACGFFQGISLSFVHTFFFVTPRICRYFSGYQSLLKLTFFYCQLLWITRKRTYRKLIIKVVIAVGNQWLHIGNNKKMSIYFVAVEKNDWKKVSLLKALIEFSDDDFDGVK